MAHITRVLVTGGAGYIGSHVCKYLTHQGVEPIVVDNLERGHDWAVRWGPLYRVDLRDPAAIRAVLTRERIDAVLHFAGLAYVGESMHCPEAYFANNVTGTLHLLEAMRAANVRTIVFSSSCAVYGIPQRIPIPEDHPQHPINPYGETKRCIERMLHWYGKIHGFRWIALRYFNAAGADPDGELGEWHDPETHLIPNVLRTALGLQPCVEIYGTDYPTDDGTAIRDYIHVWDLAAAHWQALTYLVRGGASTAVNLGTGHGVSVARVVRTAQSVIGRSIPVRTTERRPGDPPILVADPSRAMRILEWRPRMSDLETVIGTAWDWMNKYVTESARDT